MEHLTGMNDRRKHKRYKTDGMDIGVKIASANDVKICDISIGGISLKTHKRLKVGEQYTLKLEYRGRALFFKSTVIWSFLSESRRDTSGNIIPMFTVGMQFAHIAGNQITELGSLLKDCESEEDKNDQNNEFVNLSETFRDALDAFGN